MRAVVARQARKLFLTIVALKRDRIGWTGEVERMMNWGASVPTNRKRRLD